MQIPPLAYFSVLTNQFTGMERYFWNSRHDLGARFHAEPKPNQLRTLKAAFESSQSLQITDWTVTGNFSASWHANGATIVFFNDKMQHTT